MQHLLPAALVQRAVVVHLVGVGGGGAQMASCLARLHLALRARGHPQGLRVHAYDGGSVREANVGRQVYSPADIGQNKAVLTIHRLNQFYGLDWTASPCHWSAAVALPQRSPPDLLISCVDTVAARCALHHYLFAQPRGVSYWLDLGNRAADGQVCLGQPPGRVDDPLRLPCVTELYADLLSPQAKEDGAPSCSLALALDAQGLYVNDVAVRYAAQLLYTLFSTGSLRQHAVLFNLDTFGCGALPVDPGCWQRFGVQRTVAAPPAAAPLAASAAPAVAAF